MTAARMMGAEADAGTKAEIEAVVHTLVKPEDLDATATFRDVVKRCLVWPYALEYATEALRGDRDMILASVTIAGDSLRFASNDLKGDREIVTTAVSESGLALQYTTPQLRDDEEIVMLAVGRNGMALEWASLVLRNTRDVVVEACMEDPFAVQFASPQLKNSPEFMRWVVGTEGTALQFGSEAVRSNGAVVLEAVRQNGMALQYASVAMQESKNHVLEAIEFGDPFVYNMAGHYVKGDHDVQQAAMMKLPGTTMILKVTLLSGRHDHILVASSAGLQGTVMEVARRLEMEVEADRPLALVRRDAKLVGSLGELSTGEVHELTMVLYA